MNICFVMDHWEEIRPESDSTLRLIIEACSRGHNVGILYPRNLTVRDNITYGLFSMVLPPEKIGEKVTTFYHKTKLERSRLPIKGFDAVIIRKNPPIDLLMLNFLDSVKNDTLVINSVDGLRMANNKLYLTTFEDSHEYVPETYVSKDKEFLLDVIISSPKDKFVLKPLDGYGGQGVILIEKSAMGNVRSLLDFYIGGREKKNYVILQEFAESNENSDVRILLLNGDPIGAMKRIAAEGEMRANISVGGNAVKHQLTKHEKDICKLVGPKLVKDGIFFTGIDLVGDKLIEVNVLSPGGIVNINRLNKTKLQRLFIDFVEQIYRKTENALIQKMAFKKEVQMRGKKNEGV